MRIRESRFRGFAGAVPPYHDLTSTLGGLSISKSEPPPPMPPEIQEVWGWVQQIIVVETRSIIRRFQGLPDVRVSPFLAVNAAEPTRTPGHASLPLSSPGQGSGIFTIAHTKPRIKLAGHEMLLNRLGFLTSRNVSCNQERLL